MIEVTGKLPKIIVDTLSKLDVAVSDVQVAGDDIDVIFTSHDVPVSLYAIYVGDYKWVVDELDDPANLFPSLEEGDSISADAIAKLFTNAITSSLILSFSPLGKIKYGIKDKVDKVKEKLGEVKKSTMDIIDADDAEDLLHHLSPAEVKVYTYDKRDEKMKKKPFDSSGVNVGKVKNTGKKGHYKVLTGNPSTQDFQVFLLYRNGNDYRVLDGRVGLQADEAQMMFEKDVPYDKMIDAADFGGENGEMTPKQAEKILHELADDVDGVYLDKEDGNYKEDEMSFQNLKVKQCEVCKGKGGYKALTSDSGEYQVIGFSYEQNDDGNYNTNLTVSPKIHLEKGEANYIYNNDLPDKWDGWYKDKEDTKDSGTEEVEQTEEDNVEEVTSKLKKPKKERKNLNVTGCVKPDGTVVMANHVLSLKGEFV